MMKDYQKMSAMKHYKRNVYFIVIFAIYPSLGENMRKTYCAIKTQDLNSDNGADILLSKLKSLFAKEINQAEFIAYGKFEMLRGQQIRIL